MKTIHPNGGPAPENNLSRRQFVKLSAVAGVALATGGLEGCVAFSPQSGPASKAARRKGPGEPLNIALIGTQGRAANTIRDFLQLDENVVALCDVDPARLQLGARLAAPRFAGARQYLDYRKMLECEKDLDAVVVTTPDHMHAPISMLAMAHGLHVFCEKPLTHTVWEARRMRELARQAGVVTQMGTQASASHTLRRAVEIIKAGVLGDVREVHIWSDRASRLSTVTEPEILPPGLDWNLWLGVSQSKLPYSRRFCPGRWRWWKPFGEGALGDMGCHMTNVAFRALDLAQPSEIDVAMSEAMAPEMYPKSTRVVYRFPERNGRPALTLTWYDGGWLPEKALLESCGIPQQFGRVPAAEKLIIGDKGILYGDAYVKLNGEPRFMGLTKHEACKAVPETIPRAREQGTRGHYREWVEACKGMGDTYTSFEVGGAQTEMVLLGGLAIQLGHKIRWDAESMRVPGEPAAEALLRPAYRPGFTI